MKKLHAVSLSATLFLFVCFMQSTTVNAQGTKPEESNSDSSSYLKEFDHFFKDDKTDGSFDQSVSTETFNTVTIGDQIWMSENLNVSTFRNGDAINEVSDKLDWWLGGTSPAWCFYNNDASNGEKYGRLYNLVAITDNRGLAPAGWHIATEADWKKLLNYLGAEAYHKLKSTSGWKDGKNGTNEYKFDAKPGGCRDNHGDFLNLTETAYWWSSTKSPSGNGNMAFFIKYYMLLVDKDAYDNYGFAVRCVKD